MKEVNVRERQTDWKELFRAFFSPDEQLEKTGSGLKKYMNNPEYINDFEVADESIKSLEGMLIHSDKKTRETNVVSRDKKLDDREQDLER